MNVEDENNIYIYIHYIHTLKNIKYYINIKTLNLRQFQFFFIHFRQQQQKQHPSLQREGVIH